MDGVYYPRAEHLQQFCQEGEFVIWRGAFRWKRHSVLSECPNDDGVLSNHYDNMVLEHIAEDFGYDINWKYNFNHVAIVRKK